MILKQTWQRLSLLGVIGVIVASCSAEPPPPPLRVGVNPWPGYSPLYLARSLNYYPEGTVQLVDLPSTTEVTRASRNGDLDVVAIPLDELLQIATTRPQIRAIVVADISAGGDVILGRAPARSVQDLRGKRVGVESSALGAYVLARALQLADMDVADVQVVPLSVAEQEQAFRDGQIDAVVTFDPVRSQLVQAGAVTLFDSRKIPGEIVDVLAAEAPLLEKRLEDVQGLVQGWSRAVAYLKENPKDAVQRMAPARGMTPEQLQQALQLLHTPPASEVYTMLNAQGQGSLVPTLERLGRMMIDHKLLPIAPPDSASLLDPRALPPESRDRAAGQPQTQPQGQP
ncbi:MAG: ABC transporter substrate-binding protein [Cyanophyceae cyanobacterium]